MQTNIIERLFTSFSELEQAITKARTTLATKENVPETVMKRLASYDDILFKQRELATNLCESINRADWDEVSRQVGLINGLSAMIRDDARAILAALSGEDEVTDADVEHFC